MLVYLQESELSVCRRLCGLRVLPEPLRSQGGAVSVSLAVRDTLTLGGLRPWIYGIRYTVGHRAVWPAFLVVIAPTYGGMARLSHLGGWLRIEIVHLPSSRTDGHLSQYCF